MSTCFSELHFEAHLLHKVEEAAPRVQLDTEASVKRLATVTLSGQNTM